MYDFKDKACVIPVVCHSTCTCNYLLFLAMNIELWESGWMRAHFKAMYSFFMSCYYLWTWRETDGIRLNSGDQVTRWYLHRYGCVLAPLIPSLRSLEGGGELVFEFVDILSGVWVIQCNTVSIPLPRPSQWYMYVCGFFTKTVIDVENFISQYNSKDSWN